MDKTLANHFEMLNVSDEPGIRAGNANEMTNYPSQVSDLIILKVR